MNLEEMMNEYITKSVQELKAIQKECFVTIRASLFELQNHFEQNVNQVFFLLCIDSCVKDGNVDEKEFELAREYLGPGVTYDEYRKYALSVASNGNIDPMIINFVNIVRQFSSESVEEYIRFVLCFMSAKGRIEDNEKVFLEKLYDETKEEKPC